MLILRKRCSIPTVFSRFLRHELFMRYPTCVVRPALIQRSVAPFCTVVKKEDSVDEVNAVEEIDDDLEDAIQDDDNLGGQKEEELRDELQRIERVIKRVKTYEPKKKKHEWLLTLMGYYLPREKRHRAAHFMYHKCLHNSMDKTFWNVFALEPCFRTELQVLVLHMWIAKTRCMAMEDDDLGRKLNKAAFNMMFRDFSIRFEKYISGFVTKWERDCQQVCFQLALSMDHAQHDLAEDPEAYAKVIWQHMYLSNSDMEHDVLFLWSDYVQNEIKTLQSEVSDEEFMKGWWMFGKAPTMEDLLKVRKSLRAEESLPEESLLDEGDKSIEY